jgi:hypothetical protein
MAGEMAGIFSTEVSTWEPSEDCLAKWQTVQNAIIDNGTFKYVLIASPSRDCYFVRGYKGCPYHMDVFSRFQTEIPSGWNLDCVGGGRIEH